MLRLLIRLGFILLVVNQLVTPSFAFRNRGNNRYDGGYRDAAKPKTLAGTSPGIPSHNTTRRGLGISAWGIVILIVSLILAGMGFYYFSMCYPALCRNQSNKYDIMGMTTEA